MVHDKEVCSVRVKEKIVSCPDVMHERITPGQLCTSALRLGTRLKKRALQHMTTRGLVIRVSPSSHHREKGPTLSRQGMA